MDIFQDNNKLSEADVADNRKNDIISHPAHYMSKSGLEVIDVIKAFTDGLQGIVAVEAGNIIKYACRWSKKNGVQDLKKMIWYAEDLIKNIENKENEQK